MEMHECTLAKYDEKRRKPTIRKINFLNVAAHTHTHT